MLKMVDTTGSLFPKAKAIALAAELKAGDADWEYIPVHDPKGTGFSYIEIRDEDGNVVGKV